MYGFYFLHPFFPPIIIIILNITGLFLLNIYAALLDTIFNDYET